MEYVFSLLKIMEYVFSCLKIRIVRSFILVAKEAQTQNADDTHFQKLKMRMIGIFKDENTYRPHFGFVLVSLLNPENADDPHFQGWKMRMIRMFRCSE